MSEASDASAIAIADAEARVFAAMEALGVIYERMACDPALADTAAFCAHYGWTLADSANAIIVASKGAAKQYALCVLLADSRLDVNRVVCGLMGVKRASFASAEATCTLTGQMVGGVSAFGLPPALPVYIDARVMAREVVVIGGGSRSVKIRLRAAELAKIPGVRVISDLALVSDAASEAASPS